MSDDKEKSSNTGIKKTFKIIAITVSAIATIFAIAISFFVYYICSSSAHGMC